MKKIRIFTPGPVMVPEEVMLEMARPMEHHRTAWYREMHKEVHGLLQYLFQTQGTCLVFTGSGTSAMEATIVGCCPAGHKALVVQNGKFVQGLPIPQMNQIMVRSRPARAGRRSDPSLVGTNRDAVHPFPMSPAGFSENPYDFRRH